jgi:hypothetical protein
MLSAESQGLCGKGLPGARSQPQEKRGSAFRHPWAAGMPNKPGVTLLLLLSLGHCLGQEVAASSDPVSQAHVSWPAQWVSGSCLWGQGENGDILQAW